MADSTPVEIDIFSYPLCRVEYEDLYGNMHTSDHPTGDPLYVSVYGRVRRLSETHVAIYKSHGRDSSKMDWDQIPVVLIKSVMELQDKAPTTVATGKPKKKKAKKSNANTDEQRQPAS